MFDGRRTNIKSKNLGSLLKCEAVTDGLKARIEAKCQENKHFTVDRLVELCMKECYLEIKSSFWDGT